MIPKRFSFACAALIALPIFPNEKPHPAHPDFFGPLFGRDDISR